MNTIICAKLQNSMFDSKNEVMFIAPKLGIGRIGVADYVKALETAEQGKSINEVLFRQKKPFFLPLVEDFSKISETEWTSSKVIEAVGNFLKTSEAMAFNILRTFDSHFPGKEARKMLLAVGIEKSDEEALKMLKSNNSVFSEENARKMLCAIAN